jgi:MFS family permease
VFGFSPALAGVSTLPVPFGVALGSTLSARALKRFRPRPLAVTGMTILASSFMLLATAPDDPGYFVPVMPGLFLFGFGLGIAQVPLVSLTTGGVPERDQGIVAGFYNMSQQVGCAIGLAVLATVASSLAGEGDIDSVASGMRAAFVVAAGIAGTGAVLGSLLLPRAYCTRNIEVAMIDGPSGREGKDGGIEHRASDLVGRPR